MVKLANGLEMPQVGLGTFKMSPEEVLKSIPAALESGYTLFDTAAVYRNEAAVAEALQNKQVFITSKLAPGDHGFKEAQKAIRTTLAHFQKRGYLDLYLVHWPGVSGLDPKDPQNGERRRGSWAALEEAYEAGLLKAIGVSNYDIKHLQEMKEYARIQPMVNQIEIHPLYYPKELIEYCEKNNIVVQAYSSLAANKLISAEYLEKHPCISEAAARHSKTPAQVLLKWALQHNLAIIPKSTHAGRIKENIDLFDFTLSEQEMQQLDALDSREKVCWEPSVVS